MTALMTSLGQRLLIMSGNEDMGRLIFFIWSITGVSIGALNLGEIVYSNYPQD